MWSVMMYFKQTYINIPYQNPIEGTPLFYFHKIIICIDRQIVTIGVWMPSEAIAKNIGKSKISPENRCKTIMKQTYSFVKIT